MSLVLLFLISLCIYILFISLSIRWWIRFNDWFVLDYSFLHRDLQKMKGDVPYPWEYAVTRYIIGLVFLMFFLPIVSFVSFAFVFLIPALIVACLGAAYPAALFWHLTSERIYRKAKAVEDTTKIMYGASQASVTAPQVVVAGKHHHKIAIFLFAISVLLVAIGVYIVMTA